MYLIAYLIVFSCKLAFFSHIFLRLFFPYNGPNNRFYRACAKIPLPNWQRLPHHYQPGTDPIWKAAAEWPHVPRHPKQEGQYNNHSSHYLSIKQRCGSVIHRTHPRSVFVSATHFTLQSLVISYFITVTELKWITLPRIEIKFKNF